MKKVTLSLCCIGLVLGIVFGSKSCNVYAAEQDKNDFKFERRIEFLIPFGEGGGGDTTARALAPYLEKELGVTVFPRNVSGASGINGATYMHKQPADGYLFAIFSPSPLAAAVQGNASFDLVNETVMVSCIVHDTNILCVSKDSPYNSFEDFVKAAKADPEKLSIALSSIKGIDGASVGQLMKAAGIDCNLVVYGGSEPVVAVIRGETDAILSSYTDCGNYIESGNLKPILVLSEERMPNENMKNVPCAKELGYNAYLGPWRAIVCKKGTPQGAIDAMAEAIKNISLNNKDWDTWREKNGLNSRKGYRNAEEMTKMWFDYAETMKEVFATLKKK